MPVQDNLTTKLRENLARRNITVNDDQLSKLIQDYTTGRLKSPSPLPDPPPRPTSGGMFNSIGQGLGQFTYDFYESATAGLGSTFAPDLSESFRETLGAEETGFLPMGGERTTAQQIGGVIGGAAGFFAPIKWIGMGTRTLASAYKGTRAAVRSATKDATKTAITAGMTEQSAKTAIKGAVDTKVKTSAVSRWTGKPKKYPSFRKQITGKAGIYESGNAVAIQTFENGLRSGMVKSLVKQSADDGLKMTTESATEIANVLINGIREGRHINTFGNWAARGLTRKVGKEELGTIGGYVQKFSDNFINFGIYNAAHELSMSKKLGREYRVADNIFNTAMFAAVLPLVEAIPGGTTTPNWRILKDYMKIGGRKPNYAKMGETELKTYAQMVMRMDKDHSSKIVVGGIEKTLTREGVASGRIGKDVLRPWLDKWYSKRFKDFRTITRSQIGRDMLGSLPRLAVGSMFFSGALPGLQMDDGQVHYNGGLLDPEFLSHAEPAELATHALVGAFFTKRRKPMTKERTQELAHYESNYREQVELLRLMGSEPTHLQTMVNVMEMGEAEGLWGAGLSKQPTMSRVKELFDEILQSPEFKASKESGSTHGEVTENTLVKAFNKYFQMKSAEAVTSGVSNVDEYLPSFSDLQVLTPAQRSHLTREILNIVVSTEKKQKIKDVGWEEAEIKAENEVAESNIRLLEESAIAFADAGGLKYRDNRDKKGGKLQFQRISGSEGQDLGAFNEYHSLVEILRRVGRAEVMSTQEGKSVTEITPEMKGRAAETLNNLKKDTITSTLGGEVDMYIDPVDNRMIDGLFDHHRRQLYERVFNIVENRRDSISERDKPVLEIFESIFGTSDTKINDKIGSYKVVDRTGKAGEEEIAELQDAVDASQVIAVQSKRQVSKLGREETVDIDVARRLQKLMKENGFLSDRVFEDTVTLREEMSKYLWERGRGSLPADIAATLDYLTIGDLAIFPRVTSEGGRQGIGVPSKRTFEKILLEHDPSFRDNPAELKRYMEIYDKLYQRLQVVKDLVIDMGDEGIFSNEGYLRDAGRRIESPDIKHALDKVEKLLNYSTTIEQPLSSLVESLDGSRDAASLQAVGEAVKNRFLGDHGEWSVESMEASLSSLREMRESKRFSKQGLSDLDKIIIEIENALGQVKQVELALGQVDGATRNERISSVMQQVSHKMVGTRDKALDILKRDINQRTEAQKVIVQMLLDGGRAVNRPQVSNMLGQLRQFLLEGLRENGQGGRSENQLLQDFVQQRGWEPLQEYLQTIRAVNQKLVNPEAAARYERKIAEETSAFLSKQASVSSSINPNTIATKYGGIMLNKENGNFNEKLRSEILEAWEKDTSELGADHRKKIPQRVLDVANRIVADIKKITEEQTRRLYDEKELTPESGETIEEAIVRKSNESVNEFISYELPKVLATIVNTTRPLVFRYDGTQNLLIQDPDAIRMRGSVEAFDNWLSPEGEPKLTNIAYLSSEGIDSRGRIRTIHDLNVNVENVETDFRFTAEMGRDARSGEIEKAESLTRDRSQDGRFRRLAVSQGDDILYDATRLSENHSLWSTKVRSWFDTKRSSLGGPEKAGFERLFRSLVEKVEKDNLSESRSEERVLMRAMYYDFINTKGFNDLMGSRNIEALQRNASSVFKYAHLSEKRNATSFDPIVENIHERLIKEHIDPNNPLAMAYAESRAKGYKFQVALAPDEIANHPLFGARQQVLRQLNETLNDLTKNNQANSEYGQSIRDMITRIENNEYRSLEETTSNMDGAAYLGTNAAHIAFAQQGAGLGEGRGGVKPLIHHNNMEKESTLIGKQNFFYDPVIARALDAKGIDILMGESAAKFHTGRPIENIEFDNTLNFMENLSRGIQNNYNPTRHMFEINHSDVSTTFSPKSLERGRVVDAIHNWMSTSESNQFIEYMKLPENIDLIMQDAQKLSGVERNAEIRKLFNIVERENAYKEYGNHSMLNKMINWGLDSGDILVQKQILRMFNKQTIGRLSSPVSENAGTSVFTPNPDLKIPTYRVFEFQGESHRRQTTYGELFLPHEAGNRVAQTDYRDIPIVFGTNRGTGQDIVRIWDKENNRAEFYDQTLADMRTGKATTAIQGGLNALDAVLKNNVSRLTAKEISDMVQGTGPAWGGLKSEIQSMWVEQFGKLAPKKYALTQTTLKEHNAMVGHVSLRIPRQQMGDMVINRVKGYSNDPFTGNVVGVNSLDVLTKHQGDFDVDKLFWYGDAPHGVWKMAMRTSGLTVEPHPYPKTEWRADLFENQFNMTKSASTNPLDTVTQLKSNNESNKRLIGRIVRLNHSLTFLENVGLKLSDAVMGRGYGEPEFNQLIGGVGGDFHSRQIMSQKLNNVASTVLDPHKGASKMAYASAQEVIDYILFNRIPTSMSAEGVLGGELRHSGELGKRGDRGMFTGLSELEGTKADVTRDVVREMIMTVARPQRLFSGVFDETGQRQPEYWELRNMQNDMRRFYDNPNAYVFNRLWRRYGYSADGKRDAEKQSSLLDIFFRQQGTSRYRDIKSLESDIFKGVNVTSAIQRVIRFDKADNYEQFMQSTPSTFSLRRLAQADIFTQGNMHEKYDLHPYLKNITTLNKSFRDNVSLLRASRGADQELSFEDMTKLWDQISGAKWQGDGINGVVLRSAQKRDLMHQLVESDRRQIEGHLDYLYSERFVNPTRLDRLVNRYNNLKQMENYFQQKAIKDFKDPEAFGEVKEGSDRWANINVMTGKGRAWTNNEKGNKIVYEVRNNYDTEAQGVVGKPWKKTTLAGFANESDPYSILKNPIVLTPGRTTYLKRGRKYVFLNNPIREHHVTEHMVQDGLAALSAIETYNPSSFRVPLDKSNHEKFYDDVDATYNSVRRITTQAFKAMMDTKIRGGEIYNKSALNIDYWLSRLFDNYKRSFEEGIENGDRVKDIYDSLIQPEPMYGRVTLAGGQAYPVLRQNVRVVNAINRWMLEKGGVYEEAVQDFAQRKGVILRRLRDKHAGLEVSEDSPQYSKEYTNSRVADFNDLGSHNRTIYDILNDPLRIGSLGSFETSLDILKPGHDVSKSNKNKVVIKMIDGTEQVVGRYGRSGFRRENDVQVRGGRTDPFERARRKKEQGECFKG